MLDHALIAIDFSPASELLLKRAAALQALGTRRITLVHVLSSRYPQAPAETHRSHYEQRLAEMSAALKAAGFEARAQLRSGEPAAEILAAVAESAASFLLVASHGQGPVGRLLLGSTAHELIRMATCPLWLEPVGAVPAGAVASALLATDGSAAAAGAEAMLAGLAARVQRCIALAVVADPTDMPAFLKSLTARIAGLEIQLGSGPAAPAIIAAAEREQADLVIVGRRGRNRSKELLLGSTAEAVCQRSQRPVLLVPAAAD